MDKQELVTLPEKLLKAAAQVEAANTLVESARLALDSETGPRNGACLREHYNEWGYINIANHDLVTASEKLSRTALYFGGALADSRFDLQDGKMPGEKPPEFALPPESAVIERPLADIIEWLVANPDKTLLSTYHDAGSCWELIDALRAEVIRLRKG
jgi:hypothetical protein